MQGGLPIGIKPWHGKRSVQGAGTLYERGPAAAYSGTA